MSTQNLQQRLHDLPTLRHVGDGAGARDVPPEVYQDAEAILDSAVRGDRDNARLVAALAEIDA